MTPAEEQLISIALSQAGAFTMQQARDCGVSRSLGDRRRRSGAWEPVNQAVSTLAGSRETWWRRLHIGTLAGGPEAAVSRYSALSVHGLRRFPEAPVEIVIPHPRHVVVPGFIFHQVRDLRSQHVVDRAGLAVTTAARALVDCAAVMSTPRLGLVFDEVVASGITTLAEVAGCLHAVMKPGKRGLTSLARVIDERGPGAEVAESVLEAEFLRAVARAGICAPVSQFAHPSPHRSGNVVDFAWLIQRLIVEIDGRRWHTRLNDLRRDHDRDRAAAMAGWRTLRVLAEHLRSDRAGIAADIATALAA